MGEKERNNGRHNLKPHPAARAGLVAPDVFDAIDHETARELQNNFQEISNHNNEHDIEQVETNVVVSPEMPIDDLDDIQEIEDNLDGDDFPTTVAGDEAIEVRHASYRESNYQVPCHIVLNQCGTLLVRRQQELRGSKREQFFLQKLVSSSSTTILAALSLP